MATKPQFDDVPEWPEQKQAPAGKGHNKPPVEDEARAAFRDALLSERPDIEQRIEDFEGSAERCKVTDDDTLGRAGDLIKGIRAAGNVVNAAHKAAKQPYLDGGRAVDAEKNALADRLDRMKRKVEDESRVYFAKREAKRRAEEERQRVLQRRQADEAAAAEALRREAADAGDAEAMEQVPVVSEAVSAPIEREPVRSDAGTTVSGRKVWKSEVTDYVAAFPTVATNEKVREAIEKAVAAQVRAGSREIPGTRIWSELAPVAR